MPTVPVEALRQIAVTAFRKAGVPEEDARLITGLLVKANLAGHDSHGVIRIPSYVEGVGKSRICPGAEIETLDDTSTSARLKGNRNFGQVVMSRAARMALENSDRAPISLITAMDYSHCGQLGSYAEMISAEGRVGIVLLGKQKGPVVPYGGRKGRLYMNTLAVAVPTNRPYPVVLDMATSIAPFGKILVKRSRNEPCPEGWLVDGDGNPSTDPHLDLSGGKGGLLPLGSPLAGHKGSGLAFMLGILTTALSGAGAQAEGSLIIAVNPEFFTTVEAFKDEADRFIDALHDTPPAPGFDGVLVPGERSHQEAQRRLREGIYVEPETWEKIEALAST